EALTQLQNLYEREKDWSGLSKILQTLAEIETDDRKRAQLLVKLGPIYSDKIGDNKAAIRNWETLVEFEPNNRRAQDQLKKLYLAEGEMDSLEDFYAKQDKWSEFVRVLEREVESAAADKQINLLLKIAELYKVRMGKPDRSIRALEKGLSVDDNNLTVAEALIELYEEAGDERHISRPLVIKLNHSEDPQQRQELLRRLADLAERIDSNTSQAFDYYRTAFSEDHTPEDARDHLIRLAEGGGYWVELVEAFEAAIEKFGAAEESIPLRLKVAQVYEQQLNELEKALAVNQAVLDDIDAEQEVALASLERLFLALGRESDLLGVLGAQLSLADNVEDQRAIQTRIGNIHEQLGNSEDAIEAYEAVLATGVEDPTVLGALDRMYLGLEKYTELADIIRRELEVIDTEDVAARSSLLLRLGILHQEKLSDPTGSIDLFRQVLENDVANEDARTRLEGWLEDADQRTPVAGILLPVYEQLEFWPQVVQCLEIQVASEEDRTQRVELLLRIGSILIQALGDTGKAFEAYSRAFKDDPENEIAQAELEKIASVEDRYADFASLFEEAVAADEELSSELLRDLLMKLAGLYDRYLNKSDRAIECYRRAVEVDVENMPALDALEVLYSRDENWAPLLDVYRNKIALTDEPEGRQALRFQIAYIQDQMLTQVEEAIATYNEILSDDYENQKAIVALDRLYLVSEQWVELAENLERQLTLATDAESLITLNLRLGEIQLAKLEQAGMAVQTYSRVLEIDAGNETATAALETLLDNEEEQLGVAKILEPAYRSNNQWP
ncbi:MAG: tetratricopeptide repeat protein, partial [Nannocystaceae bacterium]